MTTCHSCGFSPNYQRSFCARCGANLGAAITPPIPEQSRAARPHSGWRTHLVSILAFASATLAIMIQPLSFGITGLSLSIFALRRREPFAVIAVAASALALVIGAMIDLIARS